MKKIISILLLVCCLAICLTSCSSLPEELKNETMPQPDTFMTKTDADSSVENIIKEVSALAAIAFDDFYVGYSKSDKTIYIVYYSDLSKYGAPGVDLSDVIPSVEGIAYEINSRVYFGDYDLGIVTVDGSKYSSELDILFIIKNNEVVKNYTHW